MGLSRTELFAAIRRDKRLDPELSQRSLAEKYGVHRRAVRQALLSAVPPPRKKPVSRATVLGPAKPWIGDMLREDAGAPRKQKHAARRIHQRLAQEYGFALVSYSTVCDYVLARRPQVEAEAPEGRRHLTGILPQVHLPGEEADVDFADVWVRLAGEVVKNHLFTLWLSHSGKSSTAYASQAQEAMAVHGSVPARSAAARVNMTSTYTATAGGAAHSSDSSLPLGQKPQGEGMPLSSRRTSLNQTSRVCAGTGDGRPATGFAVAPARRVRTSRRGLAPMPEEPTRHRRQTHAGEPPPE
ncbi:hypothetical protein [Streptomyces showdoensis]|uniref:hypothetical protein n=1 Tax=Streptomyces showdoensis TaxID=68268 RepID=UPI000F4E8A01|nr:hypothetical protein [Streptomyces showdoensis]